MRPKSPNTLRPAPRSTLAKYGISAEDYSALLTKQKGVCALCRRSEFLNVDHNHENGRVRGLLCGSCNYGLGCFGDDPVRLLFAVEYLADGEWRPGDAFVPLTTHLSRRRFEQACRMIGKKA